MTCENCNTSRYRSGGIVKVTEDGMYCSKCGDVLFQNNKKDTSRWDQYFYNLCKAVAEKSPCLSRKIGVLLVRDNSIVSTGYNGPPRGVPHCGHDRLMNDSYLQASVKEAEEKGQLLDYKRFKDECPRKVLGYESGTHMEICSAQHAEENAVSNAARLGVSVYNSTLYINCVIPCQKCYGTLINAGIKEIVVEKATVFDGWTYFLKYNSNIKIREF